MRSVLLALVHLAVVTATLCGSGGVRAVIAENLLLKQQLIVLGRARKRAPNLTPGDRLLCGFWSVFLSPGRIRKARIALQPSTLLAFHHACHDRLFEAHRWRANLRILEIDEIKTVPQVPRSDPFVERLIGTIRREFLDHVLFWNARDLERKLADFQAYYNTARLHASLNGHTPLTVGSEHRMPPADLRHVRWASHCRDLVSCPSRRDSESETDRRGRCRGRASSSEDPPIRRRSGTRQFEAELR